MAFLKWLAALIVDRLLSKFFELGKELISKNKSKEEIKNDNKTETKDALDKLEKAETKEEIRDAGEDIFSR